MRWILALMRRIKSYGFSDKMIAHWLKHNDGMEISESEVYQARIGLGVECVYNEVDTCAAEFPSLTPYLYSTIGNFVSVGNSAFTQSFGEFENSLCGSPLRLASAEFSTQPQNLTQNPRIADSINTECQDSSGADSNTETYDNTENSSIVSEARGLSKNCAETSPIDSRAEAVTSDLGESANLDPSNSKILSEKCGLQGKSQGSYLKGNDCSDFSQLPHLSPKAELPKETTPKKVMIIGGGPNRIGQGIEFDYCCVHSSFALNDLGIKSIMYNCNPETVSTDYDTSDVLYFEPIDFERVRAVIEREKPDGIIVHFGGQTPLKLANSLTKINAKIIGTSAKVIDTAEDREKFASFVNNLGLKQVQKSLTPQKIEKNLQVL